MMKISDLTSTKLIKILVEKNKNKVLKEMIELISTAESIKDIDDLEHAVFQRENILSTGIGLGIAIPHVRLKSVTEMTMAIGISKTGIDYNAFDDQKVTIIIMIAAPEGTHREYLSVLAKIALLLKNTSIRTSIIDAQTPDEIYSIIKSH